MMRAGFAQADITPVVGAKPTGSYRPRVMVGVHDPLLACACVIDDGNTPLALVGIDAGVIMRESAESAMKAIEQRTGIPRSNIIISASHTHQGGPVLSVFNATADPQYLHVVERGIADAVTHAWERRGEVEIGSGFRRVDGIHFNRRFLMRDGREVTHPGRLHPDIVRPAGPVDDKLGVLALRHHNGKTAGIVVNFGCHCTVTEEGKEYSADYVYYLRKHLKHAFGEIDVVFLTGGCGDVTQIDNQSANLAKGHEHAEMMGTTLATEAARVITNLQWSSSAACAFAARVVPVDIRENDYCLPPTLGLGSGEYWEPIYQRERPLVAKMRAQSSTRDCHITAMRISDLAIVANGAELFAQAALNIQLASPFVKTWVVTLANEYVGYVPTASAHYAGGYEVRLARSSYLAADAAQKITEASLRAIKDVSA